VKVQRNALGEKIATFKNVETGRTSETIFESLVAHPKAQAHAELQEANLVNDSGLVDVNPYTLQHKRYENVFGFGSCIDAPTTRSQYATMGQQPVIKRNVLQYLRGEELDGIYDGYSFIGLFLGLQNMTSFQHYYNFEPHWKNHMIPHYGIFSRIYFDRFAKSATGLAGKYSGFKKNFGAPHYHYNVRWESVENNAYLNQHNIPVEATKFGGNVPSLA